jgi:hypothetical protein
VDGVPDDRIPFDADNPFGEEFVDPVPLNGVFGRKNFGVDRLPAS